jgi:hypothetical protein
MLASLVLLTQLVPHFAGPIHAAADPSLTMHPTDLGKHPLIVLGTRGGGRDSNA